MRDKVIAHIILVIRERALSLDPLIPILMNSSGGLVLGLALGYAAKKALKLLLLISGSFFFLLLLLEYEGLITINYEAFESLVYKIVEYMKSGAGKFVNWSTTSIPLMGGLVLGFSS